MVISVTEENSASGYFIYVLFLLEVEIRGLTVNTANHLSNYVLLYPRDISLP